MTMRYVVDENDAALRALDPSSLELREPLPEMQTPQAGLVTVATAYRVLAMLKAETEETAEGATQAVTPKVATVVANAAIAHEVSGFFAEVVVASDSSILLPVPIEVDGCLENPPLEEAHPKLSPGPATASTLSQCGHLQKPTEKTK
jgi:hypothetical protein